MQNNNGWKQRGSVIEMRHAARRGMALLAVGLVGGLAGCSGGQAESKKAAAKAPVPVTVARVESKTLPVRVAAVGNGEAYASVAVKSQVDGQIAQAFFRDGQEVAAGDLLFQLDPRPLRAQLAEAEARLAGDLARLQNAHAKDRRYRDLADRRFVSPEYYAQVRTDLDAAEAAVRADRATVDHARVQLEYTAIRSPLSGRTGKILLQPGNLVKANDTDPLVVIHRVMPLYVSFTVPEQYLGDIRTALAGGPLPVTAQPPQATGEPAVGRLAFIDNAVDTATGTLRLKAEFDNRDQSLWPGQFVNVSLTLREERGARVVPATALQAGPNGSFVFVVDGDQVVALRPVVVDRVEGSEAVIADGLKPGETVVASGQLRLAPGSRVTIQGGGGGA